MAISMYSASVPVFRHMLQNLAHILDKAEAHSRSKGYDPTALTQYRLAPDMLPFTRQVLIACDAAKNGTARLAGLVAPRFDDVETTFAELKERVGKTLDYLASVPPEALQGAEEREIAFPVGKETRTMQGEDYLKSWALPNFYFHISMAYAILRHNGVDLGKADYLAGSRR